MVLSVHLAELLACTRTGAVQVAGHTELEKHPAELEKHPAEMEQHPAGLEQRPAEMEQHPAEMEQHPAGLESHPAGLESHPAGLAAVAGFWSLHYTLVEQVHSALAEERHLHG